MNWIPPGHTDLMVSPESIEEFREKEHRRVSGKEPAAERSGRASRAVRVRLPAGRR